jgi:cytochrome oxidase Cu insertion factor (SCO1/SenC/PrrC family)
MFKNTSWLLALGLGLLAACSSGAPATAAVGQLAPDFTVTDVEQSQISLGDFEDQTVLLYFSMADG